MQRQKGQSFVELAISFVIISIIISGLVDFGRMFFTYVAVEDAAGEGALYYGLNPLCPLDNGYTNCGGMNNAKSRAKNAGNELIDWDSASVHTYITYDEKTGSYNADMDITYSYRMVSPVFNPIFPDGLVLTHHAGAPVIDSSKIPADAEVIVIPCLDC